MDDFLKEALEIVKAQAGVRIMSEDEISSMVRKLASELRGFSGGDPSAETPGLSEEAAADARKSIKERSVTCMECGKSFRILTRRHLASHGLDAEQYREKWGLKKGLPLVSRDLQRERRKKMKDMKLWEKRRKAASNV